MEDRASCRHSQHWVSPEISKVSDNSENKIMVDNESTHMYVKISGCGDGLGRDEGRDGGRQGGR